MMFALLVLIQAVVTLLDKFKKLVEMGKSMRLYTFELQRIVQMKKI